MPRLYKHKNNTDVAIEVMKKFYIKEKDAYSMRIRFWNIGPHSAYCMNIERRIKIARSLWFEDWGIYGDD